MMMMVGSIYSKMVTCFLGNTSAMFALSFMIRTLLTQKIVIKRMTIIHVIPQKTLSLNIGKEKFCQKYLFLTWLDLSKKRII